MNTPEEQDPIWKLLLRSKSQQPGSAFVRNVVREARKLGTQGQESGMTAFFAWLKRPVIAIPVAIGATAVLISTLTLIQPLAPTPDANSATIANVTTATPGTSLPNVVADIDDSTSGITEDLEMIDYIGELVAITDPTLLDDAALADLLY